MCSRGRVAPMPLSTQARFPPLAAAAATHGFALRGGGNDDPCWSVDWRNKMVPVVNQMPNMT